MEIKAWREFVFSIDGVEKFFHEINGNL